MLKTTLGVIGLVVALLSVAPAQAQTMFRPVAVVNDSAITGFDLAQRARILVALGFKATNPDELRAQSLDRLVEDRLKLQEGKRLGLSVSAEDLAAGVGEFAKKMNLSTEELQVAMSTQGITELALNDMIGSEIVWRQVVRGRFSRRAKPGEAEIDAEIVLLQARTGVSYRLAEIGLPAEDGGRSPAETQALADEIYASLSQGGDFEAAVRTYSRAPSAKRGGEVGWAPSSRLPSQLAEILGNLNPGELTPPFKVTGGLSILKLLDKRVDSADTLDAGNEELRDRIRARLTDKRTQRLAEGLLQELRRDALIELR